MPSPRPAPDEIVVTPLARVRRRAERRMIGLFLVAALPVAAVLWFALSPASAVVFEIVFTLFLTYGLRRRHVPKLRMSSAGLSFEPGHFQLKCAWSDVASVETVDLPSGRTEALMLAEPHLHWAADAPTRKTVANKGWDRIIPVGEFDPAWREGPIGDAVRKWAPTIINS